MPTVRDPHGPAQDNDSAAPSNGQTLGCCTPKGLGGALQLTSRQLARPQENTCFRRVRGLCYPKASFSEPGRRVMHPINASSISTRVCALAPVGHAPFPAPDIAQAGQTFAVERDLEFSGKEFNPHFHHAIQRVETTEHPEDTVIGVLQPGYVFQGRVLRPAMVRVAAHPASYGKKENARN